LTLISFPKNAAKGAVGESCAEVFFLKKNKSNFLFPQLSALFLPSCFPLLFLSLNMGWKFFSASNLVRKMDAKYHFAANLN